jgi:hypothetical protein
MAICMITMSGIFSVALSVINSSKLANTFPLGSALLYVARTFLPQYLDIASDKATCKANLLN